MPRYPVILIGGAGPPAEVEFALLIDEMGDERDLLPITPIAFQGGVIPAGFSLVDEIQAVANVMDRAAGRRVHLVGYSGGAAIALAVADAAPHRVASVTLEETPWVGNDGVTEIERSEADRLVLALQRPPAEAVSIFRELMVQEDVLPELKPLPPDAPWLRTIINGVLATIAGFRAHNVDWAKLRDSGVRFYGTVGGRSNPVFEARTRRAATRVPGMRVDVFAGLHHINPPHRGAPRLFADALRALWADAEGEDSASSGR